LSLDEKDDIKVVRYLSRKVEWLKHLKEEEQYQQISAEDIHKKKKTLG